MFGMKQNYVNFSKIEAGKLELEKNSFTLRPFLEQVVSLMEGKAAEKGLQISRTDPGAG